MMESEFNVSSLNTAGIGDSFERHMVFNYLKKNCSSNTVIFLSETHSVKKKEEIWNSQWDVVKILRFLHMGLQIAMMHLLRS